jgi:hypothetical protein|tara:strand:- start:1606 stop:2313 length:708 start_codon:yes stop_codon:yes gene_type:complete
MNNNWITLHRKLIKWEWYTDSQMVHLFVHLLISANHKEGSWKGNKVKRGQLITGIYSLSKDTGISVQSLRTCLKRLKSTNELTIKSTNQFSLITLLKYSNYQDKPNKLTSKSTSKLTNEQQTTNKRLTTNNNNKQEITKILSANADEKDLVKRLINDNKRYIHIIGLYWEKKNYKPTAETYQSALRRDLKASKTLEGYSDDDILAVMDWLNSQKLEYIWKLETVHKLIDDYISEK